jgi:5-enolpyruvylshikimate-3-phosphate synthase
MAAGLVALGVTVRERPDGLDIVGGGPGFRFGGSTIDARHDHRIAMAFAVAGLRSTGDVRIDGMASAGISDPGFARTLAALSAGNAPGSSAA